MTKDANNIIVRLITDPSFRSWCLGNATALEDEHWERWVSNHAESIEDVNTAKKIVLELEQTTHRESKKTYQKYESWAQINKRISSPVHHLKDKPSSLHPSLGWMLTAAATILLLLVTMVTIEYTNFITVSSTDDNQQSPPELLSTVTDYGERKVILLDSGTRITLNANSSVTRYDGWVYDDTVRVQLQGEAFFDVTPRAFGEGPVFEVQTDDGNINVLGTRFMVNTWDKTTKVVLEKGKVALQHKGALQQNNKAVLNPSELAVFSQRTPDISIKNVNTSIYTSWTEGVFEFDRALLTEVADRIEKIFGKEVVIADPILMSKEVSGAVENDDLDVLLSALSRTLEISIVEHDDQIVFRQSMLESSFINQTLN